MKKASLLAVTFSLSMVVPTLAQEAQQGNAGAIVTKPSQQKGWFILTNAPGWKGYGSLNENGWLLPERFQNIQTGEIQETGNNGGTGTMVAGNVTNSQVTASPQSSQPPAPPKETPTAQTEVLGADQQVYFQEYGGYCVAAPIIKGQPDAIGKWRVKYKVNTPQGNYTYKAHGNGAQSYATAHAGFLNWLNGTRAQYGLPPVGYDSNLEAWASQNNAHQAARGLGHYVMGPARRQNSAMSGGDPAGMWMASGPHRAALLDPSIRAIGLAFNGQYWTFNAN